ncbi:MAG TPA: ParB/RepB/Spo0J family partition protein [Nevskiaceae bacterium]|nr:ParB/RepB/Spo0J family partition protein [Nevskiaceae bacterium]
MIHASHGIADAVLPKPVAQIRQVPIDLISPGHGQARRHFGADALAELARSIAASGLVQPIVLRHQDRERFELLAGERRWRAAQMAGLHELPAIVRDDLDDDDAHVLGLIENLQRESLSPMETAEGLSRLATAFHLTHEQVGQRIGKSRVYVTNFLRLLTLEASVREQVDAGRLSLGHAKALCGLPAAQQRELGAQVCAARLSVRATERRVAALTQPVGIVVVPTSPRDDLARLERALGDQLGYAVHLQADIHGAGRLSLQFGSLDELDGLLARLGYDPER